jgi:cell wall-associated NlpC family hydrolase
MNKALYPFLFLITVIAFGGCLPAKRIAAPQRGSATTGASTDALTRARQNPSLGHDRRTVVEAAGGWIGTPYLYGGTTRVGVDCSGFVLNVFRTIDRSMPRQSQDQASVGEGVDLSSARPGDLVFFNTSGAGVSHVGIMLDYPEFIHASTSRGVTVSSLESGYYREHVMFARRVID